MIACGLLIWHKEGTSVGFSEISLLDIDTHPRELCAVLISSGIPLIDVGVFG